MDIDAQKAIWIEEQHQIAANVQILPDTLQGSSDGTFMTIDLSDDESSNNSLYGGVDVSFPKVPTDPAVAVYVIVETSKRRVVYQDHLYFELTVPYIPSFLAFREIEPLSTLIDKQRVEQPDLTPQAILVDGNGILHERKAGIASALGVRIDLPTIGVGKTFYHMGGWRKDLVADAVNKFLAKAAENVESRTNSSSADTDNTPDSLCMLWKETPVLPLTVSGDSSEVTRESLVRSLYQKHVHGLAIPLASQEDDNHSVLACILVGHGGRTNCRRETPTENPIFISVGHKISLQQAVAIACRLSLVRIPEPVRQADLLGRELLRQGPQTQSSS